MLKQGKSAKYERKNKVTACAMIASCNKQFSIYLQYLDILTVKLVNRFVMSKKFNILFQKSYIR